MIFTEGRKVDMVIFQMHPKPSNLLVHLNNFQIDWKSNPHCPNLLFPHSFYLGFKYLVIQLYITPY